MQLVEQIRQQYPEYLPILQEKAKMVLDRSDAVRAIPKFMKTHKGVDFKMAPIHKSWHSHIDANKFSLIIAPRDHGKSEQIAIGRILVEMGNNPDIRIKMFSGKAELAKKRVSSIKRYISNDINYRKLYPKIKRDPDGMWTYHAIKIKGDNISKEPTLEAYGVTGTATGDRADLIVCDDICTFENTIQKPASREMVKDKFYNDIMNLLEPDGRLVYISTLWHNDDLSSELIENLDTNGFSLLFQSYDESLSELLWEWKWTRHALEERRAANIVAFDRGFRNIPISDEDALFKRYMVNQCIYLDDPMTHVKDNWCRYIGVDLAIGRKESNDYTVIFVIAIDPDKGTKIPIEITRRRMTSPETARVLIDASKRHKPNLIYVENNAYQDSLIQWIQESGETELPIEGFHTGKQKFDEFIGLPSMAAEFANHGWRIYNHQSPVENGSVSCKCSFCVFIDELINFPIGKHDDTIMAAWFAREAARKDSRGGFDVW